MIAKRFIPEVTFNLSPIELEAKLLYDFSQPRLNRWKEVMNRVYPDLENIVKNTKDKTEAVTKCREFAERIIEGNKSEILKAKDAIETDWNLVSREFLTRLSKLFEIEWPEEKRIINAYITIMPVFPRFLDDFSFCVGYRNPPKARETIAHEIVHFLWFKKWKEVFPDSKREEFEGPHLIWRLSEIMDPIILQCDPKIKELIKPSRWGYPTFKDVVIEGVSMTEYFVKIYMDCVKKGKSFEEVLKILWAEALKNREAIEKF